MLGTQLAGVFSDAASYPHQRLRNLHGWVSWAGITCTFCLLLVLQPHEASSHHSALSSAELCALILLDQGEAWAGLLAGAGSTPAAPSISAVQTDQGPQCTGPGGTSPCPMGVHPMAKLPPTPSAPVPANLPAQPVSGAQYVTVCEETANTEMCSRGLAPTTKTPSTGTPGNPLQPNAPTEAGLPGAPTQPA